MKTIESTPVVYRQRPDVVGQRDPYMLPQLLDPVLTDKGIQDAEGARQFASQTSPELVVVSPLRRATLTALIAFDHVLQSESQVPFMAHELLREGFGEDHICDQRLPRSELAKQFPQIDYSHVIDDTNDELFFTKTDHFDTLVQRAYHFMLWISSRPEKDIVISTHSTWLLAVFNG